MLIRRCFLLLGALLGFLTPGAYADTESRLALLIGNSSYKASPLINPVNDVRLMETALKDSGFTVIKAENASIREMRRLVRDFGDKLKSSGGVGLFYFAGHGVQVRGENFLVSTDSDIRNEDEVADDSINASVILEKMQSAGNRMNLIVLDACRNNPFANKSRSAVSGLANMNAPSGSLVAYSTAPGSVASDGAGKNGLYTEHLAKVIRQPGLPVEEVFKQVRAAVRRDSNNQQTPWENTALEGQFFFKAPLPVALPTPAPVPAAVVTRPSGPDPATMEMALWDSVKSATTVGELQAYLNRFPAGFFAEVARARISVMASAASAASDSAAASKAATERAAADAAAQAAAAERASAQAARKATEERLASQAAQQAARDTALAMTADQAAWGAIRASQSLAELQAYLLQFPNGSFSVLAHAKMEELKNAALSAAATTALPAPPGPGLPRVGDVIGTLVMKDMEFGTTRNLDVTVLESNAEKIVYSSGDVIASSGRVLQVRVGAVVLQWVSGALWAFPLQVGTSGEAKVRRTDGGNDQPGELSWKAVAAGNGKIQIEANVLYSIGVGSPAYAPYGKWSALYRQGHTLPESFAAEINGRPGQGTNNRVAGEYTQTTLATVTPPAPEPVATAPTPGAALVGDVIGTLVMKDTLTGIKHDVEVTVQAADAEKTTYSTGDVIARDGRVLQVRVGEVVLGLVSGSLWTLPLKAGTSGNASVKRIGSTSLGKLNWQAVATASSKVQIVADVNYSQWTSINGKWTAIYGNAHPLPESFSAAIRGNYNVDGINMVSAELQLH